MHPNSKRQLGYFLIFALFFIYIQVMIGGITRLTGSGLSITDWKIVTGTIPPITETQWNIEFDQYKASPQYEKLNEGMTMGEFQFIYFWEWFHRVWGRWGFVFLLGVMIWFWMKKKLDDTDKKRFGILLFLYFCQGLLGWFMVMSGLIDMPYVSHYRLASHLLLALFLFAFILWWVADIFTSADQKIKNTRFKKIAWSFTALIVVQIVFGAFMSGLRAAGWYPTWPDMNGEMIPSHLFNPDLPFLMNFLENRTTIQFTHRGIAYLLFGLLMWYFWKARGFQSNPIFKKTLNFLPFILIIQVLLGIFTLIYSSGDDIPVMLGVMHQSGGLILLSTMLFLNFQYE